MTRRTATRSLARTAVLVVVALCVVVGVGKLTQPSPEIDVPTLHFKPVWNARGELDHQDWGRCSILGRPVGASPVVARVIGRMGQGKSSDRRVEAILHITVQLEAAAPDHALARLMYGLRLWRDNPRLELAWYRPTGETVTVDGEVWLVMEEGRADPDYR